MTRYFKHPDSDQVEEVDAFQVLAVLFLGPLYLLFAGLWRHLLIWGAALGLGLLAGRPGRRYRLQYCPSSTVS
ncbi:hypothetical protein [Pseudomonas allii]|uniref:hypothetical protein n=1 Tax=Pseudomonas allii TaxID=2740531 RepID=UPI001F0485C5|nr:hypothetical protein [Pseudomonas allii]